MKRFHSTRSLSEVKKEIIELVAANSASEIPQIRDFDELISLVRADIRPWWLKEVDKPTEEIDWNSVQRYDESKWKKPVGKSRGYTDHQVGLDNFNRSAEQEHMWHGTPDENTLLAKAVLRLCGAEEVGVVELDQNSRKLVFANYEGKSYDFGDVDIPYETADRKLVPYRCKWVISFLTPGLTENTRPNLILQQADHAQRRIVRFLRRLGYFGLSDIPGAATGFGILAGLGEMGRHNRMVSPHMRNAIQNLTLVITDLPLVPTKPVDGGVMNFCRDCKKCALLCPNEALSFETEPYWETKGTWNNPGVRAWYEYSNRCQACWKDISAGRSYLSECGLCCTNCVFRNTIPQLNLTIMKEAGIAK